MLRDGDRSSRGSGQPQGPNDAATSSKCSGPDPRNPSGPAVPPTAHTGRTYDRNRPDPSKPQTPCTAGAVHIWVPASAGTIKSSDLLTRTARSSERAVLLVT